MGALAESAMKLWKTVLLACAALAVAAAAVDYDVVVYGSTPAGIAAATAAGHLGMSVAIYEPLKMIGGMGAAGNLALHDGGPMAQRNFSGLALKFTMLNAEHYGVTQPVAQPESFVANASFYKMLSAAQVTKVALDCRLSSAAAKAGKVQSISVLCEPNPISATVFIDASYDGEIMVAAGVEHISGREAMSTYNESLAGSRIPKPSNVVVDALHPDGSIIKYVQNVSELKAPGERDDALMAFQHRMCISGDEDRLPWKKPKGYDRDDFLLFERYINASGGKFNGFGWPPQNMHSFGYPRPKNKYTLCCGITIAASDQPNLNKGWSTASWDKKQQIIADHTYFELGMFYFLSSDPSVPVSVRDEINSYGICSDEFQEFDHIPPQLYIRESNRLVGDYVMTQNNIAKPPHLDDSITTAHWWLDMHMTGKYAVPVGGGKFVVQLEGNFPHDAETQPPAYDVPFKMMLPKRGTGTNLLVPVCLSTSHAAFASTRIETMLMGTGTAAGVAAKQLVDGAVTTVQDVDVSKVQSILTSVFKQTIHTAVTPTPGSPPGYFNVTGAGSKSWNGQYHHTGTSDSVPSYEKQTGAHPHVVTYGLYRYAGLWRLAIQGKRVVYVAHGSRASLPPLTGWSVANGTAPTPTLIVGPTKVE